MQKRGLLILLLLLPLVTAQDFIQKGAIPEEVTPAEVAATLAKPGVVQIQAYLKVSAIIPELKYENGQVTEIGPGMEMSFEISNYGSGFIVTPDGYIVTNAHVVQPAEEDTMTTYLTKLFDRMQIPDNQRPAYGTYLGNKIKLNMQVTEIVVLQQVYGPNGLTQTRLTADLKETGKAYPGKDVAIIKVPRKNMPTVSLGKTEMPVGADVLVIGYPGAAKIGQLAESSVTAGILSAYKQADEGWRLAQIDAAISSGSSGGPAFDRNGRVIGVATLSSNVAAGFNWLVPMEIVDEFLAEASVKAKRGPLDQVYERAVANYWNQRYEQAVTELHHTLEIMPNHPFAPELLFQSRVAIEEKGHQTRAWKIGTAIFGLITLATVIILFFFVLREKQEITQLRKRLKRH